MTLTEKTAEWAKLIAERSASGQSKAAFCRERGIRVHSYDYWEKKQRLPAKTATILVAPRFIRADFETSVRSPYMSIRFAGGVTVESCGYPDPAWITAVARAFSSEEAR